MCEKKQRSPRNKTLCCSGAEMDSLSAELIHLSTQADIAAVTDKIINQDYLEACRFMPKQFVDLMVLDPPYNLAKNYNGRVFKLKTASDYTWWFDNVMSSLASLLKPSASLYVCSDWQTSNLVFPVLDKRFKVRNRITWEREKGRGAKNNWKNNTEDIWFCTMADDYYFDVASVKLKKRVIAPYRLEDGTPKDWKPATDGNYRLTHPSNLWSDITIPFWSMPENTSHPTQKPEKLIAKLILASSRPGDMVLDPFLGSGTTAVVARKLNRRFCGMEINRDYCCWAVKRLRLAERDKRIQGYTDGIFLERNSQ